MEPSTGPDPVPEELSGLESSAPSKVSWKDPIQRVRSSLTSSSRSRSTADVLKDLLGSDESSSPELRRKRKSPNKATTPKGQQKRRRNGLQEGLIDSLCSREALTPQLQVPSPTSSRAGASPSTGLMAPTYRNQNRRQNRTGVVDHDIFEGLPVRQWRRDYVTVAPPPTQDSTTSQNDIWAVELPHGMPKDSHLLPQHSQDLLRAARSGKIYKRPAPPEEEEADPEAILGDKPEKKEEDPKDKGFTAKAWKPIPRHLEGPDIEYLAKKRKGLVAINSKPALAPVTLTKTTVKRIDAAGNEYVQDVVVPHGQQVEGEVIAQTVIPDPNAATNLFNVQPTPPKRKATSSKKRLKGPGRGRKKKQAPPTSVPQAAQVDGPAQSGISVEGAMGFDGVKIETDANPTPTNNEDTEMGDGSMAASDDDDGDEGEEGEDGDDDEGSVDIQSSPSKPPRSSSPPLGSIPPMKGIPNLGQPDTIMGGTELARPRILTERERLEGKSGSPLKTVALTASTLTSPIEPSPVVSTTGSLSAPTHQSPLAAAAGLASLNEIMQQEAAESAPTALPPPPPEPTNAEMDAAIKLRQEEEEEEMLLDIGENALNAEIGGPETNIVAPELEAPAEAVHSEAVEVPRVAEQPVVEDPKPEETALEADDDEFYPDLLGGLEKSLEKKEVKLASSDTADSKETTENTAVTEEA